MRSLFQILTLYVLSLPLVVSGVPTPDGGSGDPTGWWLARGSRGIDVSGQRNKINWNVMAEAYLFAYIEATRGTS